MASPPGAAVGKARATIRAGRPEDAERIAALANRLNVLMGEDDGLFSREQILRDIFGERPPVEVLVAVCEGEVAGYAFYHDSYNTDIPARSVWLVDLMVDDALQRRGLGKRLMATVARETLKRGAKSLAWAVMSFNTNARQFYESLGALDWDTRIIEMDGAPLDKLAAEAER
jgi:GNAT superfamily N-acetyltransferase